MDDESARKKKDGGAHKTSSWKKEKWVHSGVHVMVLDILFGGKNRIQVIQVQI